MTITEVTAILGGPKATIRNATTGTSYAWFDYAVLQNTLEFHLRVQGGGSACPPGCPDEGRSVDGGGLMVLTTQTGQVTGVRTYYAPQYVTAEGLRIGAREDQVRSALGAPANIEVVAGQYRSLEYPTKGITFRIQDNPNMRGYRTVYLIDVYSPQPSSHW
jgi:hypothetical protein